MMMRYLLLLAWLYTVRSCVFKYGNLNGSESEALAHSQQAGGTVWTYNFAGLDWQGVDAQGKPWTCIAGMSQSPVNTANMEALPLVPEAGRSIFDFGSILSDGTNIQVINNGHTIQVEWNDPGYQPNASIAVPVSPAFGPLSTVTQLPPPSSSSGWTRVALEPLQFHFHTHSEHMIEGALYPLELHVVSRAPPIPGCTGAMDCLVVVGIMLQADPDAANHSTIADLWSVMPLRGGVYSMLPPGKLLDFATLLPPDRSYLTYTGSLTTPPCTEGVTWHVLTQPVTISLSQYEDFLIAVGDYQCNGSAIAPVALTPAERADEAALLAAMKASQYQRSLLGSTTPALQGNTSGNGTSEGTCTKLGAGANYRIVQHLNQRPVRRYVQAAAAPLATPSPLARPAPPGPPPSPLTQGYQSGAVALIAMAAAIGAALMTAVVLLAAQRRQKGGTGGTGGTSSGDVGAWGDGREKAGMGWSTAAGSGLAGVGVGGGRAGRDGATAAEEGRQEQEDRAGLLGAQRSSA